MSESPQRSGSDDFDSLRRSLSPSTLSDLFKGYGIPQDDRVEILREAIEVLIHYHHRARDLRGLFLGSLEQGCRVYIENREAEDEQEDRTASDA